jgi:hypothetical protein
MIRISKLQELKSSELGCIGWIHKKSKAMLSQEAAQAKSVSVT